LTGRENVEKKKGKHCAAVALFVVKEKFWVRNVECVGATDGSRARALLHPPSRFKWFPESRILFSSPPLVLWGWIVGAVVVVGGYK